MSKSITLRTHAHVIFFLYKLKLFSRNVIFLVFAQNIDSGYTLAEAVLMSTHNLCFGEKLRKIGILLHTPVLLCKSGV